MRLWIVAVAAILTACSNASPDEKLADDLQPISSWTATLAFAAEGWLGNRVPASFVRATIKSAQKAFENADQTIAESKASERLRETARQALRDGRDAASALTAALQRDDRTAALHARSRLLAAHQSLEEMKRQ